MKTHRIWFTRRARSRRGRSLRGTTVLFRRFSSFEGLELRALLSGNSLLDSSGWYASANTDDAYATSHLLSVASLTASCLGHRGDSSSSASPLAASDDAPPVAALAATSDEGTSNDPPPVSPLVEGVLVNVFFVAEDLVGNTITSIQAGEDFKLKVFVDDVRTSAPSNSFGVVSAYVRAAYDTELVSLDNPNSVVVDSLFLFGSFPQIDVSTLGIIAAGGLRTDIFTPPGSDPQLLWSGTLRAAAAGTASFDSSFTDFTDFEWLMYDENDVLTADNISFGTLALEITAPTVSISDVTQSETNASQNFVFTVSLSVATTQQVTVAYATSPGTANDGAPGQDFEPQSATMTFAPGITQQLITISVLGDQEQESNETFTVVLSDPVNATLADATGLGTIVDDDIPKVGIAGVSQPEGNEENTMVFTVTLSLASDTDIVVPYTTQSGTATAGNDFTATSGTLTFAAGNAASQFITVTILGDTVGETNENFQVVLTEPANAVFDTANGLATGTLVNDDGPLISFVEDQVTQLESQTQFVFTVSISEAATEPVTVAYTTQDGTAIAGQDYTAQSGTLTFTGATLTQNITITVLNDAVAEANESFSILLSDPVNGTLAGSTAAATIENDDGLPRLAIANSPTQNEGNQGATPFPFTVTLSQPSAETVTVAYTTVSQTASSVNGDFEAQSGTLTFLPNQTVQVITVLVTGDNRREPVNETFAVSLSNPHGATIANGIGNAVVVDDDPAPSLSISDVSHAEGDAGTTPFVFTVTLSAINDSAVTVGYATQNGTATTADYSPASGTLTFLPGTTTQVITVFVIGDNFIEPDETFSVVLSNPSAADIADNTGIGTILSESSDEIPNLPSTISGKVFLDGNGNGLREVNEKPLSGIVVALTGGGNLALQTTTGADGSYSFNNLDPGTYTITFGQPAQYRDGIVHLGSQGGSVLAANDSFTFTISEPGGVVGTENNFTTIGLLSQFISQRLFLASTLSNATNPPAQEVTVAINSVTNPINAASTFNTTISGTGTAGATISVVAGDGNNSTAAQTTTVAANGTWSIAGINVSALADGTITYDATATGTGNSTAQASIASTKDVVAPDVAITTVTDPVTADSVDSTSISGTGTAGATISVVVSDGNVSTPAQATTVAANGTWSIAGINVTALADGTITYTATASDAAGNKNSAGKTAVKDTTAPMVGVSMVVPDPINAANQTNVTISGTGEAGASITVIVSDASDSTGTLSTTVGQGGTWSISGIDVSSLDDGTLTFTVTATDAASNTTTITETAQKDTVTTVNVADVTDPITGANQQTVTISGTGEANASVTVVASDSEDSTVTDSTTVDGDGNWSITIDVTALLDGEITFTATATDAAGNTATDAATADKDTATQVAISQVTDPIGIEDQADTSINGTGEVGATISVVASDGVDSTEAFTTNIDGDGNWSISGIDVSALADGTITYTVTATDLVGNTDEASLTATKATLVILSVTDPINAANDESVTISGTGEVGASISVVASDGETSTEPETTTVDGDGDWSITINVTSLSDGTITFTVTATVDENNSLVKTITAEKDTLAPSLEISIVTDPITAANVATVIVSGTGEVGAAISVLAGDGDNSVEIGTTVDGDGNWSVTLDTTSLLDGTITFTVTATDAAGNTDQDTTTAEKDTVAQLTISEVTDPIGIGNRDNTSISGTGEVGASISVVVSDGVNSTDVVMTTVDGDGNWSINGISVSDLADGTLTYTVTTADLVGNTNEMTITAMKATLVINPLDPFIGDFITISGTGEVGAAIMVVASDGDTSTEPEMTTIDEDGNWSVNIDISSLAEGAITFTVTATDSEDNSIEKTVEAVKDTVAPALNIDSVTDPINAEDAPNVSINGTGEVGVGISVVASDGDTTTDAVLTTVDGDGNWTVIIDVSSLNDGTITFTVTATDGAGNTTQSQTTAEKDTVAELAISEVTDPINAENADSTSISGTGEVNGSIEVVVSDGVNSTDVVMTTVDGDGNWSIAGIDVSLLDDGTLTYTVTITDALGNTTQMTITATKDTVAPALVIDLVTNPIDPGNEENTSIGGTGEVGAQISVVASDGLDSTIAFSIAIDGDGNWTIAGIDVSALADGTITYTVTATDAAGNVTEDQITADKSSAAEPLTLGGEDDDDEEALVAVASAMSDSGDDPDAIDEVLAGEDDWLQ